MKQYKAFLTLFLFSSLLLITSCDENPVSTANQEKLDPLLANSSVSELEAVYPNWQNGSLNGVVFIKQNNQKIYDIYDYNDIDNKTNDTTEYEGIKYYVDAAIFDGKFDGKESNGIMVNSVEMNPFKRGAYKLDDNKDYLSYFSPDTNTIEISDNDLFKKVNEKISFGAPIKLENIDRGDTISRKTGFNLKWKGTSLAKKVKISIGYSNSFDPRIKDRMATRIGGIIDNTGSYELQDLIKYLKLNAYCDLLITQYEPQLVNLSNGKKLLVIGESTHTISFLLKD